MIIMKKSIYTSKKTSVLFTLLNMAYITIVCSMTLYLGIFPSHDFGQT
jgi:class 3 adenylate cyclase